MKKIIILLVIGILFPINAHALTGNVEIQCDNYEVSSGSNINCTLKGGDFSSELSSFHAKLLLGNNLALESIEKNSSWEGSADGGVIDLYTDVNKSGDLELVTFVIKVDEVENNVDTNISITDIKIGDSQFEEHSFPQVITSIKITSTSSGTGSDNNPDSGTENNPDVGDNPDTGTESDKDVENGSDNIGDDSSNTTLEENTVANPSTGHLKVGIVLVILVVSLIITILYKKKINNI